MNGCTIQLMDLLSGSTGINRMTVLFPAESRNACSAHVHVIMKELTFTFFQVRL